MAKQAKPFRISLPLCWSTDSLPPQILPETPAVTLPSLPTMANRMSDEGRYPTLEGILSDLERRKNRWTSTPPT